MSKTKTKPKTTSQPILNVTKSSRFKQGKKLKGAKIEPQKTAQLVYTKPQEINREVPAPNRDTAMAISKSILEHTYWLGRAVRDGDKKSAQREVDVITRFSTLYMSFASNPSDQPLKFGSADNYPENAKKYKGGKKAQYESDETEN